jgi:hypothetical protein
MGTDCSGTMLDSGPWCLAKSRTEVFDKSLLRLSPSVPASFVTICTSCEARETETYATRSRIEELVTNNFFLDLATICGAAKNAHHFLLAAYASAVLD